MGSAANVLVGAATSITIAAWIADKAASGYVDIGYTKAPTSITPAFENYDTEVEQEDSFIKTRPTKTNYTIKIPFAEATLVNLRKLLGQAAGNLTGTGSDLTLLVTKRAEQYWSLILVGPGPGTNGVRTTSMWKCQVLSMGDWTYSKAGEQIFEATLRILFDTSVTTVDKMFRVVDT